MHLDQGDALYVYGFKLGKRTVLISMMPPRSWIPQLDPAAGSLGMQRDDVCFCLLELWECFQQLGHHACVSPSDSTSPNVLREGSATARWTGVGAGVIWALVARFCLSCTANPIPMACARQHQLYFQGAEGSWDQSLNARHQDSS